MMGILIMSDVLPFIKWIDWFSGVNKALKKTARGMGRLLQTWLDEHKNLETSSCIGSEKGRDFMNEVMSVASLVAEECPMYDADTINKATCQTKLLGGTDAMTATVTWTLSFLLNNRPSLKMAQEELTKIVGKENQVRESDIDKLVYLQAVLKEAMRLQLSVPVTVRESQQDCILAGYHVPAGTRLFLNAWKIQRDPNAWTDPLEFRPERFLTNHTEIDVRGHHYELLPFGGGRRVCPGITFSMRFMQLELASFLHSFDINTPLNEPVDVTGSLGFNNMKANPFDVVVTPRLSPELYA